jgi:glutathione S-transferase
MQEYLLSPHVYLCITDDHAVLLDLQRDKYVGVGRAQMNALAARVLGWPTSAASDGSSTVGDERADAMLAKMRAAGLLTTDRAVGKEAHPLAMPRVERALLNPELEGEPTVAARDVARFLHAAATAGLTLRWRSIETVVARVRQRKARRFSADAQVDYETARALVGSFVHLRPLLFGAQDACLFDSLAIVELLARRGIFPTWVFGVQTAPFAAHCWVQDGPVVFNDTPERVRRFTPILAI